MGAIFDGIPIIEGFYIPTPYEMRDGSVTKNVNVEQIGPYTALVSPRKVQ